MFNIIPNTKFKKRKKKKTFNKGSVLSQSHEVQDDADNIRENNSNIQNFLNIQNSKLDAYAQNA